MKVKTMLPGLCFIMMVMVQTTSPTATLKILFISYTNSEHDTLSGSCCDPAVRVCRHDCKNVFHICVTDQYNPNSCKYSNITTGVFDNDNINFHTDIAQNGFRNPITSKVDSWQNGDLTFKLKVTNAVNNEVIVEYFETIKLQLTRFGETKVQVLQSGFLKEIVVHFSVYCDDGYLLPDCEKQFCLPRNDEYGHYMCDSKGVKLCLTGWVDPLTNCTSATSSSIAASFLMAGLSSTSTFQFSMLQSANRQSRNIVSQFSPFTTTLSENTHTTTFMTSHNTANVTTQTTTAMVTHFKTYMVTHTTKIMAAHSTKIIKTGASEQALSTSISNHFRMTLSTFETKVLTSTNHGIKFSCLTTSESTTVLKHSINSTSVVDKNKEHGRLIYYVIIAVSCTASLFLIIGIILLILTYKTHKNKVFVIEIQANSIEMNLTDSRNNSLKTSEKNGLRVLKQVSGYKET